MAKHKDVVEIAKALSHPIRIAILEGVGNGRTSPVRFASTIDKPIGTVSYHFIELHKFGALTLVETTPRRGAIEHVYAASKSGKALQRLIADLS